MRMQQMDNANILAPKLYFKKALMVNFDIRAKYQNIVDFMDTVELKEETPEVSRELLWENHVMNTLVDLMAKHKDDYEFLKSIVLTELDFKVVGVNKLPAEEKELIEEFKTKRENSFIFMENVYNQFLEIPELGLQTKELFFLQNK